MIKFLSGIIVGAIISFNLLLNSFDYRISFYGYKVMNGKLYPIVKLRKKIKNHPRSFSPMDEGMDLEIGEFALGEKAHGFEFDDGYIDRIIKHQYC